MATDTSEDRSVNQEVQGVVQAAVDALGRAGSASAGAMSDAVEGAARSLTRRMVVDAVSNPRRVDDREALARALAARPVSPALAGATVAALGLRLARRFRRLGFLARRTPMWLVATAVPALLASVSRGADELGLVASNLVLRARAKGIEPDPERLRRVAVQIASRRPVDPEQEPRSGPLVVSWLRRAFRAVLPFTAGVATSDPEGLAAAAADVDPTQLAAP
ncbi:MAG TPA: hypothetical protein VKD21_00420 [Acidimicrobiales bacterium]|nr:hypothetical protein [Acidimicrobiales bacterium]